MATKLTVNCTTGKAEEVEMDGEELTSYEALRAAPEQALVALEDRVADLVAAALKARGLA